MVYDDVYERLLYLRRVMQRGRLSQVAGKASIRISELIPAAGKPSPRRPNSISHAGFVNAAAGIET